MSPKQKTNKAAENKNIGVKADTEDETFEADEAVALHIDEGATLVASNQDADIDDRNVNKAEETPSKEPSLSKRGVGSKRKKSPSSQSSPVKSARHSNSKDPPPQPAHP